jgi:hypothetical protein
MTFKTSLADLMTKMMSATPHFIRCIKPNGGQQQNVWEPDLVLKQLRSVMSLHFVFDHIFVTLLEASKNYAGNNPAL